MTRNLTHAELVDLFSSEADISKKEADRFIKTFANEAKSALIASKKVSLSGLGTFKLQWVKQRKGKHPKFGTEIQISAHYKVKFNAAKRFSNLLNSTYSDEEMIILEKKEPTALPAPPLSDNSSHEVSRLSQNVDAHDDKTSGVQTLSRKEKPNQNPKENILERIKHEKPKPVSASTSSLKTSPLFSQPWLQLLLGFLVLVPAFFWIGNFIEQPEDLATTTSVENFPISAEPTTASIGNANKPDPSHWLESLSVQKTYTTAQGDWFYKLAEQFYQRKDAWIVLFAYNDHVLHPDSLFPNIRIEVPEISALSDSEYEILLAWSYFDAYQRCRNIDSNLARDYLLKAERISNRTIINQNRNKIPISDAAYVQLFQ